MATIGWVYKMANISENSGKAVQGFTGKLMVDEVGGRILLQKNGVFKMLIGVDNLGTELVKIAQDGIDVFVADDDQLIFNSENNLFKIVDTGLVDVVKAANTTSASDTATSAVDYPTVIAFVLPFFGSSSGTEQTPYTILQPTGADAGKVLYEARVSVNGTTLTFIVNTPQGITGSYYPAAFTARFKYYVVQETSLP